MAAQPKNALQAVLDRANKQAEPAPDAPAPTLKAPARRSAAKAAPPKADKSARPVREGQRFVGGHFDPKVHKALKMLMVEDDTTMQALLEEAIDDLMVKKGKGKIIHKG